MIDFLRDEEIIHATRVQVYTPKGKRVETEDTEECNVLTLSSTRSLEPRALPFAGQDEIVIIEKEVHNRRIQKYIEERTESMKSLIEVLENRKKLEHLEKLEKEKIKKETNMLHSNKKYKLLRMKMEREERDDKRRKVFITAEPNDHHSTPSDDQSLHAPHYLEASLLPELPSELQLTPNSNFRRFFKLQQDTHRKSPSPKELALRKLEKEVNLPSPPSIPKPKAAFLRRYGSAKPHIPVRHISKGETYSYEDLATIFSIHYNSEKFQDVLLDKYGDKKMERESDKRFARSKSPQLAIMRSTLQGQQIMNSVIAQNHDHEKHERAGAHSKTSSYISAYKRKVLNNFASLDALQPLTTSLTPQELTHSLMKKPVSFKYTAANFLTSTNSGGKVAIGKNHNYSLIMTKYKSDFGSLEKQLRHFFLFTQLQSHFYREECDLQQAMRVVLVDEEEFALFVEQLSTSFRIVRNIIVKQFYKRLRVVKEVYMKKVLKALQVFYPDESMSFNDFVRVCYFVLERKATKYEKITIVAKLISQLGEQPELSQFIKLVQLALRANGDEHDKLIMAIVDSLTAHGIVDSSGHLDLNVFLAIYGKQELKIEDLYDILI